MRTTIHLIRHADAAPDSSSALSAGTTYDDVGLNSIGAAQADALAHRIARGRRRPAAIYASPTRRARETAAAIARALDIEVTIDDGLREIYLGDVRGDDDAPERRASAIRERLDALAAIAVRDGSWDNVAHAERAHAVRARMTAAVDAIVARHRGTHVALVSHAGTINAYLAGVLGTARDFFFLAGNTSLSSVTFADGSAALIRINDTAHLEAIA